MRRIRQGRVRPLPLKNRTMDASMPTSNGSSRDSASNIRTWGSSPQEPASRSGSISSFQSESGPHGFKGLFSRGSSVHSGASSAYQEIVFDSRSAYSGSQASGASAASGRRGPLDSFAKAAMSAVKRVGACWRCKFLRKSVCPNLYPKHRKMLSRDSAALNLPVGCVPSFPSPIGKRLDANAVT